MGMGGVSIRLGVLAGLLVLTGFLYAVFYLGVPLWGKRDFAVRFQKELREYDALFEAVLETSTGASMEMRHDDLLKKKLAVIGRLNGNPQFSTLQTTLSLLKRERVFARYDRNFRDQYEEDLGTAEKKYPATVQLQALSTETALKDGLSTIADALNVGALIETFLAAVIEPYSGKAREHLLVDAALLSIVRGTSGGEYRDTNAVLYPLDLRMAESMNTFRFAAEYAYDAGDFSLSSRLFAALPDEGALERAGDALFLGGDTDGARELWRLSADANSLYNYASLSEDTAERITTLEALLAQYADPSDPSFIAALILYTRLLSDDRAAAVLGTSPYTSQNPLLDLELWRRTEKNYPADRALAGMWLLVGRHIEEPPVYEYASWYFGRKRQYEELALLLKNAALQGIAASDYRMPQYWQIMLDARAQQDHVREALAAFRYGSGEQPWFVGANIGRLYEAERSWENAVDHYRAALANAPDNPDKSRLLQRIAVCLSAQGRNGEAFAALEEAVSLDPANLTARSALNGTR
jgi:tetratricopeptide (TPR) repeat protein